MFLSNFATRSEIIHRENKSVPGYWPIGIDYGFSGIKCFAPNKVFCFPNCAVKVSEESFNSFIEPKDTDILLHDETGFWFVGEKASENISTTDAMNYEGSMYGRDRYFLPAFGAIMKVGLAIALSSNHIRKYQGETIIIQTGLPPRYRNSDTELIKEALSGSYSFDIKIGKNRFQHYEFNIVEGNIFVMDQPMGSLISTITDNDGVKSMGDYRILSSRTIVFDPGFKTLDIFDISGGNFKDSATYENLGMYEIFSRTIDELRKKHHVDMTVSEMQEALKKGYVVSFNRKLMQSQRISFDEILERHTNDVCRGALQQLLSDTDSLKRYDYLIITGGTGNAWLDYIMVFLKNMESLTVVCANKHDPSLSNIYSNVRGYYMYLVSGLAVNSGR